MVLVLLLVGWPLIRMVSSCLSPDGTGLFDTVCRMARADTEVVMLMVSASITSVASMGSWWRS